MGIYMGGSVPGAIVVHTFRFGINLVAFSAFGRLETQPANASGLKLYAALEARAATGRVPP